MNRVVTFCTSGTIKTRLALGAFVFVVSLAVSYLSAYLALRAAHQVSCTSNAWHWHPEKRDLAHHFDVKETAQRFIWIFRPLISAEGTMRTAVAWLAHDAPRWLWLLLVGNVVLLIGLGRCLRRQLHQSRADSKQ